MASLNSNEATALRIAREHVTRAEPIPAHVGLVLVTALLRITTGETAEVAS